MTKVMVGAFSLLTRYERKRGMLLMVLVVIMAGLETLGIASVMPVLAVIGDERLVVENPWLAELYRLGNFQTVPGFMMALAGASFILVFVSAVFRAIVQYALAHFVQMRRHSIGARLLETYLRQPYEFFLNRHSGDLAKSILSEVDTLVVHVYRPLLDVIAYAFVAVAIVALLIWLNPFVALIAGVFVGGLYLLVFSAVKGLLGRLGRDRVRANTERFSAAGEAIAGIKDIKLLGRENAYLSRFLPSSVRFARYQALHQAMAIVPKYLIEAAGLGGILLLAIFLVRSEGGAGTVLPLLGVYAFAGYRLLPAAQHIYAGLSSLRFGYGAIEEVARDLSRRQALAEIRTRPDTPMRVSKAVALDDIWFRYEGSAQDSLKGITLKLPALSSLGIVGQTGAGKTTVVDILLGLLEPTRGTLRVDDVAITPANVRKWQAAIGYVPQHIFLSDGTIAENIAFGVPASEIDMGRVRQCAEYAQLGDVIESSEAGFMSCVGEKGVRLSGGQKQRIGIARALYHDPSVLVLDEATSALDGPTEVAVMRAVRDMGSGKTIVIIAHRLSTVRQCDQIVLLGDGQIQAVGTYDELVESNTRFREMVVAGRAGPEHA